LLAADGGFRFGVFWGFGGALGTADAEATGSGGRSACTVLAVAVGAAAVPGGGTGGTAVGIGSGAATEDGGGCSLRG
jgi:hypothetical protein